MRLVFALFFSLMCVQSASAENICDDLALHNEVKDQVNAPAPSANLKTISYEVEKGISKGLIKDTARDSAISTVFEYSLRHRRKCDIPQSLRDRIYNMIALTKADAAMCERGQFQKVIDRQHRTLKATEGYEVFEGVIKTQVAGHTPPQAQEKFNTKWDNDEGFRDRVIRAGLRLNVMFSNNCKNVPDPILDIIEEFK